MIDDNEANDNNADNEVEQLSQALEAAEARVRHNQAVLAAMSLEAMPANGEFDLWRLPCEIRAEVEKNTPLELLEPGLRTMPDPLHDELVVYEHDVTDRELCRVPMGRLREVDPELVRRLVCGFLDDMVARGEVAQADQVAAYINDEDWEFIAPAASDYAAIKVHGRPFLMMHRRDIVPGWVERDAA